MTLIKKEAGRPTKKTDDVVKKLEQAFQNGANITEACAYAKISREVYYTWLEDDKEFLTKMESAKYFVDLQAKRNIVKSIVEQESIEDSKWWLQYKKEKAIGVGVDTPDGGRIEVVIRDYE